MEEFKKIDIRNRVLRNSFLSENKIQYFKNQNYIQLKNECLKNGRLFEDPLFRPTNNSLYYTRQPPRGIKWMRPNQICRNPKFIVNTANANDLDQGYLGNCWFIAGCAAVTFMPELFDKVVPKNQELDTKEYAGIFHFRFWIYGFWHDVVVDDWLPVWDDGRLVFCSNKEEPNEFWAALLEKAYAKVCGSYENMEGGFTTDALIDMSGGIEESLIIDKSSSTQTKNEIWKIIYRSRELKSMNGASIEPDPYVFEAKLPNGLIKGHAYTITKCALIEVNRTPIKLLRMRNPWGRIEWRGDWSDDSNLWNMVPENIRRMLEFKRENEGEFWINFDDFYRNFDKLELCHITPDAFSDEILKPRGSNHSSWNMIAYHSEWIINKTAGGSGNGGDKRFWQNPQFVIKLVDVDVNDNDDLATVIISLMQKNTREKRTSKNGDQAEEFLQFRFYQIVNDPDPEKSIRNGVKFNDYQLQKVGNSGDYINKREITKRFRVKPGYYLIIPSLFEVNVPGEFLLRIFTEESISDRNTNILYNENQDDNSGNNNNNNYTNNHNKNNFSDDSVNPSPKPSSNDTFKSTLIIKPIKPVTPVAPKPSINIPINTNTENNNNKHGSKPKQADFFNNNSSNLDDTFNEWISVIGNSQPKTNIFDSAKKQFKEVKESFLFGENAKKQFAEGLTSRFNSENLSFDNLKFEGSKLIQEHLPPSFGNSFDNIQKVFYDLKKNNKNKRPQEACLIQ